MYIFVEVCLSLQEIHEQNIIHRDIKPDNIFCFDNDIVKIGDFGVSKSIEQTIQINSTFIGTPSYMAPEIFLINHNIEVDIWSLGVFLYEICSLELPFRGNYWHEIKSKIPNEEFSLNIPSLYSDKLRDLIKN